MKQFLLTSLYLVLFLHIGGPLYSNNDMVEFEGNLEDKELEVNGHEIPFPKASADIKKTIIFEGESLEFSLKMHGIDKKNISKVLFIIGDIGGNIVKKGHLDSKKKNFTFNQTFNGGIYSFRVYIKLKDGVKIFTSPRNFVVLKLKEPGIQLRIAAKKSSFPFASMGNFGVCHLMPNGPRKVRVNTSVGLRVRTGPGTHYKLVRTIKKGVVLKVVDCSADGKWLELAKGNWISRIYSRRQKKRLVSFTKRIDKKLKKKKEEENVEERVDVIVERIKDQSTIVAVNYSGRVNMRDDFSYAKILTMHLVEEGISRDKIIIKSNPSLKPGVIKLNFFTVADSNKAKDAFIRVNKRDILVDDDGDFQEKTKASVGIFKIDMKFYDGSRIMLKFYRESQSVTAPMTKAVTRPEPAPKPEPRTKPKNKQEPIRKQVAKVQKSPEKEYSQTESMFFFEPHLMYVMHKSTSSVFTNSDTKYVAPKIVIGAKPLMDSDVGDMNDFVTAIYFAMTRASLKDASNASQTEKSIKYGLDLYKYFPFGLLDVAPRVKIEKYSYSFGTLKEEYSAFVLGVLLKHKLESSSIIMEYELNYAPIMSYSQTPTYASSMSSKSLWDLSVGATFAYIPSIDIGVKLGYEYRNTSYADSNSVKVTNINSGIFLRWNK